MGSLIFHIFSVYDFISTTKLPIISSPSDGAYNQHFRVSCFPFPGIPPADGLCRKVHRADELGNCIHWREKIQPGHWVQYIK